MKTKYSPDIEPRHLHFEFPEIVPPFWHDGCPIKTYYFNAFALFLPTLEQLVILSLKKATLSPLPAHLKMQVASLIAQEAIHGREFKRYTHAIVLRYYPFETMQYKLKGFRFLSTLFTLLSPTFHTALSAAGEHLTAISSVLFLKQPQWFEGIPASLSAIWRWHCIEEIEHKTVAYDVFQTLNGNYFYRIIALLIITTMFFSITIRPFWRMMKHDGHHKKLSYYLHAFRYGWGKQGLYRPLIKPYLAYFKPHFHPNQSNDPELIATWKAFFKNQSRENIAKALQYTDIHVSINDFKNESA